jgi:hypothetical protein
MPIQNRDYGSKRERISDASPSAGDQHFLIRTVSAGYRWAADLVRRNKLAAFLLALVALVTEPLLYNISDNRFYPLLVAAIVTIVVWFFAILRFHELSPSTAGIGDKVITNFAARQPAPEKDFSVLAINRIFPEDKKRFSSYCFFLPGRIEEGHLAAFQISGGVFLQFTNQSDRAIKINGCEIEFTPDGKNWRPVVRLPVTNMVIRPVVSGIPTAGDRFDHYFTAAIYKALDFNENIRRTIIDKDGGFVQGWYFFDTKEDEPIEGLRLNAFEATTNRVISEPIKIVELKDQIGGLPPEAEIPDSAVAGVGDGVHKIVVFTPNETSATPVVNRSLDNSATQESAQIPRPATTSQTTAQPATQPATRPLTLREIFDTDFSNTLLGVAGDLSVRPAAGGKEVQIRYRVLMDFTSLTKFVAFFMPSAPDAEDVCAFLANNLQIPFETVSDTLLVKTAHPGETAQTSINDLKFTGRVYVYHEDHFSTRQLADLEELFKQNGAVVQFRGNTYLVLHWNEKRQLLPTAAPPADRCSPDDMLRADFGTTDLPDSWKDETKSGEKLVDRLKRLFKQPPNSVVVSPKELDMDDPGGGGKKLLRMYVPGGKRKNLAAGMLLKWEDAWEA